MNMERKGRGRGAIVAEPRSQSGGSGRRDVGHEAGRRPSD